jgi:hypothetical protein
LELAYSVYQRKALIGNYARFLHRGHLLVAAVSAAGAVATTSAATWSDRREEGSKIHYTGNRLAS